ncbi:MAG: hypothetical protein ABSG32_12735 [Terriglobia bacterium]
MAKGEAALYSTALILEIQYGAAFCLDKKTRTAIGAESIKSSIRFDPGARVDQRYEIVAVDVDGDGNRSPAAATERLGVTMAFQSNRRSFLEALVLSGADWAVLAKADEKAKFQAFDGPSQSSVGVKPENGDSIGPVESGDAYARFDPAKQAWICGTGLIEQELELAGGNFRLAKLSNRLTGTEYVEGASSDEFHFFFGGREYAGDTGGYKLKDYQIVRMPVPKASPGIEPGVTLVVNLEHPLFLISLHYDVFASTPRTQLGMIRKWYRITNRTKQVQPLTDISMNRLRFKPEDSQRFTLHYWIGGGSHKSTDELQSDDFKVTKARTFYSMSGQPDYRADDIYSGSASYHPYFVLEDPKAGEGFFFGFNYLGPWSTRIWNPGDHMIQTEGALFPIQSQLELHTEPLDPSGAFDVPNSFLGVFKGDLDAAGEQLQDWQATFKWDYTRERYLFLSTIYDTHWDDPAYKQKTELHKKLMWEIADRCRITGAGIAHEDDFWFDERGRGVWEGIEWTELVTYLRQSGIIFKLWMPPQHFAAGTPQDLEHPEWALVPKVPAGVTVWYGHGFCSASQGAHDYMRQFMLGREKRYGTFYWRLDGWIEAPCASEKHDHPPGQPFVQQYRHYLDLIREVKVANPQMGIEGCNSGGEWANWDKFELIEDNQGSDGGGPDDLYYLSYFWPITKMMGFGGDYSSIDDAAARQESVLRGFLQKEGIYDRYMRVYHPRADGAPTPHTYLEFTNGTRTKAVIVREALPKSEAVVYPKALIPETQYSVAFRFGKETRTASGAELMKSGIRFASTDPNEMILLNLDRAPGRGTDHTPPTTPGKAVKKIETWNGRAGVAVRWEPSQDDGLVSHYEVLRDGKLLDYVAIGTFYFEPGARIEQRYEIVAVDGDGNRSPAAATERMG